MILGDAAAVPAHVRGVHSPDLASRGKTRNRGARSKAPVGSRPSVRGAPIASRAQQKSAPDGDAQLRLVVEGLEHDAIALGQLEQLVDLVLRRVGVDLEVEADRPESDR